MRNRPKKSSSFKNPYHHRATISPRVDVRPSLSHYMDTHETIFIWVYRGRTRQNRQTKAVVVVIHGGWYLANDTNEKATDDVIVVES